MLPRDMVRAIVRGELPDRVPLFLECPMDNTVYQRFGLAPTGDAVADALREASLFGNLAVGISLTPTQQTLRKSEQEHVYRYETGAVWRESFLPTFCREALEYPVSEPKQAFCFSMPTIPDARRESIKAEVSALRASGLFVEGNVPGAWQGSYYFIAPFESLLEWLLTESEAAKAVIDACAAYSLEAARVLLDAGVDGIIAASDLGTGTSLLMSARLIREFVVPWMRDMAELCHQYGALFHLHSHGHIEQIMDDIVDAGVDIVNPIGPTDNNDLAMFKARWGDRITLHGGISSTVADMSDEQMRAHLESVMETGRKGGRFFPRSESGVPPMSDERLRAYLRLLREFGQRGYTA